MTDAPERIWIDWKPGMAVTSGPLAAPPRQEYIRADIVPQWKPIETAPRDGTPFLTFSTDAANDQREGALGIASTPVLVMAWLRNDQMPYPVDENGDWHGFHCYEPTHWQPLPPAPEVSA